ncbi:MAG TPA: methyltransferase domain-containing protein [Jiangellaceae bacterium]
MPTQAPTQDQIRSAWNSTAPGYDEFATPLSIGVGQRVLGKVDVGPGTRFLDVAAGSGGLSIPAARTGANVLAIDIAPTMLERLAIRARSEGLSNVDTRAMPAADLDLPDSSFDVTASQFGVTIIPDATQALAEMVRVTKPGGTVLLVGAGAMAKVEFFTFFLGAIQAAVPEFTPPPEPPAPFQLEDLDAFTRTLTDAGLSDVAVDTLSHDMQFESAEHLWSYLHGNPLVPQLLADLTEQQRDGIKEALDGLLRERSGGEPGAVLHAEMRVGTGTK